VISPRLLSTLLALPLGTGAPVVQAGPATSQAAYSSAVAHVCSGALLFERRHAMGTRADALAVARDIRASTRRRLALVAAVRAPRDERRLVAKWVALERRLADVYATNWMRIFDVVDAANTPRERAHEVGQLERLVHAPDALRRAAARLERVLNVPDCTGGEQRSTQFEEEG